MNNIKINHPKYDYPVEVSKESYITAKWKDLQEFGYPNLTRDEVVKQVENILEGKPLNIIGMFMKDDIVIPAPAESETTK